MALASLVGGGVHDDQIIAAETEGVNAVAVPMPDRRLIYNILCIPQKLDLAGNDQNLRYPPRY